MVNSASQLDSIGYSRMREERTAGVTGKPHSGNRPKPSALNYGGLAPWQLLQVKNFIEKNLFAIIRIKTLTKLSGLSESYFYAAFRRSTGQTPHSFIIQQRISHAQKLMLVTDLPLSQIACECGLTDQPHLTRLFHRQLGTSPALWRKRHRSEMPQKLS